MTLEKLINKLTEQYVLDSNSVRYQDLKDQAYVRLKKKIIRLNFRNKWKIELWHTYLLNNEDHFYQRYEDEDFAILYRSDAVIENYYNLKNNTLSENVLFNKKDGNSILCLKNAKKAVFDNPISNQLESWTNLYSVTRISSGKHKVNYAKHLFESKYKGDEAKYNENVEPQELEFYTFAKGVGYLRSSAQMFIFIAFKVDIGTIKAGGKRKATNIIKIQIDRESRPQRQYKNKAGNTLTRRQGYLTKIHGYPISSTELKSDFPAGHRKVNEKKFDLPVSD